MRNLIKAGAAWCLTIGVASAQTALPAGKAAPVEPAAPAAAAPAAGCSTAPNCNTACNPCPRFYGGAEWLYWQVEGNPLPPLVTTSPNNTPLGQAGVLGAPGTTILAGNGDVNDDYRSGVRATLGYWFSDCQKWGIEGQYFILEDSNDNFAAASAGIPILARPFNTANGQNAALVAFPGLAEGTVSVNSRNEFWGAGALLRRNLRCNECGYLDALIGYRYLNLTDETTIGQNVTGGRQAGGATLVSIDQFRTENDFNGGVLGLAAGRKRGCWIFEGRASVALGNNHRVVSIGGSTTATGPNGTVVVPGGLLTAASNSGTFTSDVFSVVPEVSFRIGYQFNDHVRVFAGYQAMYWTEVQRSGSQIDTTLGAGRPAFLNASNDIFVQGASAGIELRY